jgi:hypothetical protein
VKQAEPIGTFISDDGPLWLEFPSVSAADWSKKRPDQLGGSPGPATHVAMLSSALASVDEATELSAPVL